MKKLLILLSLLGSSMAYAKDFYVDTKLSSLSFTTTTNKFLIENAEVAKIKGHYKDNKFSLMIDMNSLDTGIEIRNEQVNKRYLTHAFSVIKVQGEVNLNRFSRIERAEIPAKVTLFGNSREIMLPVIIQKGMGYFSVHSTKPIIIKGSEFGIPAANLAALAATVGNIEISDTVPVNFNVVFSEG